MKNIQGIIFKKSLAFYINKLLNFLPATKENSSVLGLFEHADSEYNVGI